MAPHLQLRHLHVHKMRHPAGPSGSRPGPQRGASLRPKPHTSAACSASWPTPASSPSTNKTTTTLKDTPSLPPAASSSATTPSTPARFSWWSSIRSSPSRSTI
ncbi:unnamed protein product [Linum tenue]|uniref:Uncharacterized protein n=1 Tax=Linum tenue TaxID=586396 RepID=A0AAV0R5J7_9ROSI|nr:unnamed protein product [Linum tenue]